MTHATVNSIAEKATQICCEAPSHSILRDWRLWLAVAAVAVVGGLAFNWSWFIAVGVAPLLLSLLPCVVMCALGLCMGAKRK